MAFDKVITKGMNEAITRICLLKTMNMNDYSAQFT